jgi:hypothetical protein
LQIQLTVVGPVPCAILIALELLYRHEISRQSISFDPTMIARLALLLQSTYNVLQVVATSQVSGRVVAVSTLVVVVALLTLLGGTGDGQEAEDGEGFELHCAGDWYLMENGCKESLL